MMIDSKRSTPPAINPPHCDCQRHNRLRIWSRLQIDLPVAPEDEKPMATGIYVGRWSGECLCGRLGGTGSRTSLHHLPLVSNPDKDRRRPFGVQPGSYKDHCGEENRYHRGWVE